MKSDAIRAQLLRPWTHGQATDLRGITVTDPLDLTGLTLSGVDFTGARFVAPVRAAGAVWQGLSWFTEVEFADQVDFSHTLFINDARFDGAHFARDARFSGTEFRGIARFDRAEVLGLAEFSDLICFGNAAFGGARLRGGAQFSGGEFLGGFWGDDLQLSGLADFSGSEVHGRLWLKRARLGNMPLAASDFGLAFGYVYT
jgi:uncharacterized protein YjbI with pentapeptide repeats